MLTSSDVYNMSCRKQLKVRWRKYLWTPHISSAVDTLAVMACMDGAIHSVTQQKHAFLKSNRITNRLFLRCFFKKNKQKRTEKNRIYFKEAAITWQITHNRAVYVPIAYPLFCDFVKSVVSSVDGDISLSETCEENPIFGFVKVAVPINRPVRTGVVL